MYELFLALFLAFSCPAHSNNQHHQQNGGTTVTTNDDTEGEGGHIPPGYAPPPNP